MSFLFCLKPLEQHWPSAGSGYAAKVYEVWSQAELDKFTQTFCPNISFILGGGKNCEILAWFLTPVPFDALPFPWIIDSDILPTLTLILQWGEKVQNCTRFQPQWTLTRSDFKHSNTTKPKRCIGTDKCTSQMASPTLGNRRFNIAPGKRDVNIG